MYSFHCQCEFDSTYNSLSFYVEDIPTLRDLPDADRYNDFFYAMVLKTGQVSYPDYADWLVERFEPSEYLFRVKVFRQHAEPFVKRCLDGTEKTFCNGCNRPFEITYYDETEELIP